MNLPSFSHIRPHTAYLDEYCWTLNVSGIDVSGYTRADGSARDLMIHFPRFAIVVPDMAGGFPNGVVI